MFRAGNIELSSKTRGARDIGFAISTMFSRTALSAAAYSRSQSRQEKPGGIKTAARRSCSVLVLLLCSCPPHSRGPWVSGRLNLGLLVNGGQLQAADRLSFSSKCDAFRGR